MRILIRTSKWAIWSRRLGSFALPLSVLPVWMHRNQMMTSETFQLIFFLAMILAFLAVLVGIGAYFRLWQTGDHGWGKSTLGIFLGLICLSPLAYGASLAFRYPLANDVSTDIQRPLELLATTQTAVRTPLSLDDTNSYFPGISTRNYDMNSLETFKLVDEMIRGREWDIRVRRRPGANGTNGQINAMAMTFLGWRDEVAFRIVSTPEGSRLDMRSASLNGAHDLGANGNRIEQFLADMDEEVLRLNRVATEQIEPDIQGDETAPASDPH